MLTCMKLFPARTPLAPLARAGASALGAASALISLMLSLCGSFNAQTPTPATPNNDRPPSGFTSEEILWPNGAPLAVGSQPEDQPRLYCYPAPGAGPHAAVVVLPGGGYLHLVNEKEGAVEARWLNAHGVNAYILQYRLSPRYQYPAPMLDGLRAVRFVRAHAKDWSIRPDAIGVWGFSAGGHLAGYLATADPHAFISLHPHDTLETAVQRNEVLGPGDDIDKFSAHPDFAILSYARLSLDPTIPGTFGMVSILGKHPEQADLDAISPILHVTPQSSPSFIYATEHDASVNSQNATLFFNALQKANVPAELHVFELGPHGTGMGQNIKNAPELAIWPLLLENWMRGHNWITTTPSTP
jgi:acetyl esterase/lipase